ncbi:hypothetical protein CQ054_07035 [Ochrobactrum sp. MYb29]|nr:hypothetical protein CQ054_07035 [Ochrobactrum sp. MYb29]
MEKTPNYKWDLPSPKGFQIVEIAKIATTFGAIDTTVKSCETKLTNHKHAFADLTNKPETLEGYGITDGMTSADIAEAIKAGVDALVDGSEEELSTLRKLASALGNDPKFADKVEKALEVRVRVDAATGLTLAQKAQGRANIGALGAVDRGSAGGVASLDNFGKVPAAQLPALTTTSTVGAAIAGANGKTAPADGDFIAGVEAGGSNMFKTTWANIKVAFTVIVNSIVAGNMPGRAYPRRSDGVAINFQWSGQGGQPTWLWGGHGPDGDAGTYRVWNPSNFSVNYANRAWTCDNVGGWNQPTIAGEINWRVSDARSAGYVEFGFRPGDEIFNNNFDFNHSGYYVCRIFTWSRQWELNFGMRQPQIHIPNIGWRALGGW